ERRALVADRNAIGGDADERGEEAAPAVDELVVIRGLGAARPPHRDGLVEGLDDASRRQPDARGVDVHARGLEFLLRDVQTHETIPPQARPVGYFATASR